MELRQISYFMWVYEEGSFSRAATRTDVAQPALSMQIKRLEEELGVQLFERSPKGVKPTDAAKRLYRRCSVIMQQVVGVEEDLRPVEPEARLRGTIRVGLAGMFSRGLLKRVLLPFMEKHPLVEIIVSEGYASTLDDWIKNGAIDVALSSRPNVEGSLVQRLIFKDRVVLLSGTPSWGPSFTPIDLREISDLKLITPSPHHNFGKNAKAQIEAGAIRAVKLLEINSIVGAFELALNSDWAVLTSIIAVLEDMKNPRAFIYPVVSPKMSFDVYVVFDRRRPPSPAAKQFVRAIELELQKAETTWPGSPPI